MKINGEKAYPIYKVSIKWIQDRPKDSNNIFEGLCKGLPKGRMRSSTNFYWMYKIQRPQKELYKKAINFWNMYKETKDIQNPELVNIIVEFKEYETWMLTWFEHQTFDVGQTNEEALKSFEKFVQRKTKLILENKNSYCLMGAGDRWRWHGAEPNGDPEDHSSPPCRCKYCKKNGLLKIAH